VNFETSYSYFVHLSFGFEVLLDHLFFLKVVELRQCRGLTNWAFQDLHPHLVNLVNYLILVINGKTLEQCFQVSTFLLSTLIGCLVLRINFVDAMMPRWNRFLFELLCSLMLGTQETLLLCSLCDRLQLANTPVCNFWKDVRCNWALLIAHSAVTNLAGFIFLHAVNLALIRVGPQLIRFVLPIAFLDKLLLFYVVIYQFVLDFL
jgi:hypothetical protein